MKVQGGRAEKGAKSLNCRIYINSRTVADPADLWALSLGRKHFTCTGKGLPYRLYGTLGKSQIYTQEVPLS